TRFSRDWSSDVCSSDLGRNCVVTAEEFLSRSSESCEKLRTGLGHCTQARTSIPESGTGTTRPNTEASMNHHHPHADREPWQNLQIGRASGRERGGFCER